MLRQSFLSFYQTQKSKTLSIWSLFFSYASVNRFLFLRLQFQLVLSILELLGNSFQFSQSMIVYNIIYLFISLQFYLLFQYKSDLFNLVFQIIDSCDNFSDNFLLKFLILRYKKKSFNMDVLLFNDFITFLTMKAIKMDSEAIDKAHQYSQNDNYSTNIKEFKKRHVLQLRNKPYDPQINKIEARNNSPSRNNSQEGELNPYQPKTNADKCNLNEEEQKQSKSSLKLPAIIIRGGKRSSYEPKTDDKHQNSDFIRENKITGQGIASLSKYNPASKMTVTEDSENDKVSSFLKYIQIKPMKPAEKNWNTKTDMSVRDLKLMKDQKSIPTKKNSMVQRESSTQQIRKKSAQNKLRLKKNQQKSQKNISNYVKKQRRALSISQGSQHVVKRKVTNSYYDFCNFICLLNKVQRPMTPVATYKAFVGKGNNSILVKNCLKSRFWWNIGDSESDVNLFWTQVRDQKFVQTLKTYSPQKDFKQQMVESKQYQFVLPKQSKQTTDKNEQIREYTNFGLNRLLSDQERKLYSKSHYQVQLITPPQLGDLGNPNKNKMHNHLQFHWHLSNKKALYYNLKKYYAAMKEDPFQYIPLTFHIQKYGDQQWKRFMEAYSQRDEDIKKKKQNSQIKVGKKKKQKNLWIVKPGQNSNQGNGIQVFDNCEEIAEMVKTSGQRANGRQRSYIIQRYLMPFLYNKRKFDIRCYVLVTCIKGVYKAYWYQEGYIRTSSKEFTLKNLKNRFIHLTNDAVQKKSQDYGKYENGNKISFADFQKYLDNCFPQKQYKFFKTVYPAMIKRASDAIKSTCMLMDSKKRQFSFEIFGLDFMIDEDFATWLIEVNTNPCLQLSSPLLARIIPNMVQNALKIAVDPLFPPPRQIPKTKNLPLDIFESNKFTLIFNSCEDQEILTNLTKDTNLSNIVENDEEDQIHDQDQ